MKTLNIFLSIVLSSVAVIFTGCKPTEKNYKSAYDAALGKREAAQQEMSAVLPSGVTGLQQIDGPSLKKVDGEEIYVMNKRLTPNNKENKLPGNYNVVVGKYQMPTNSEAQSRDLRERGYAAFAAKDGEENYYVVAGSFDSMSDAKALYNRYKRQKDIVYVGLPDSPVIIFSPK